MSLFAITSQEILDRISRHCPEALSVYLNCINRSDADEQVFLSRDIVRDDLQMGWAKFKNHLRKLALENLLEWHYDRDGILITLAELYEDE